MTDGSISQDEIDALLSGVDMDGTVSTSLPAGKTFTDSQKTAISAFFSDICPSIKSNYDSMTGADISIDEPSIFITNREGMIKLLPEMVVASVVDFSGGLSGDHVFIQSPDLAKKIVGLVNNEPGIELDDMALSVLSETISQHVGVEFTKMESGGISGVAHNPADTVHVPKAMVRFPQQDFSVFQYTIGIDGVSYSLWEVMQYKATLDLAKAFGAADSPESLPEAHTDVSSAAMVQQQTASVNGGLTQQRAVYGMNMNPEVPAQQVPSASIMPGMSPPNVQPVQLPNLPNGIVPQEQGNIGLIMDVYMEMTVELGRTKKVIKDILGMGEGTIIELDKLAGEPVDILVNHKPIAKGEVVVIDENFGVRVTEILSPTERISDI